MKDLYSFHVCSNYNLVIILFLLQYLPKLLQTTTGQLCRLLIRSKFLKIKLGT